MGVPLWKDGSSISSSPNGACNSWYFSAKLPICLWRWFFFFLQLFFPLLNDILDLLWVPNIIYYPEEDLSSSITSPFPPLLLCDKHSNYRFSWTILDYLGLHFSKCLSRCNVVWLLFQLIECPSIYELLANPDFQWENVPLLQLWRQKHDDSGNSSALLESYEPKESIALMTKALSNNAVSSWKPSLLHNFYM